MNNKKKKTAEKSFTCPTRKQQIHNGTRARSHFTPIQLKFRKKRAKKTPHVKCSFRLCYYCCCCCCYSCCYCCNVLLLFTLLSYEFIMLIITYCCGYCLLLWCLNKITISHSLASFVHILSLSLTNCQLTKVAASKCARVCLWAHALIGCAAIYCTFWMNESVCIYVCSGWIVNLVHNSIRWTYKHTNITTNKTHW